MVKRAQPLDEPEDPEERRRFWEELVTQNVSICGRHGVADETENGFETADEPGVQDTPEFWEWLIELRAAMWQQLLSDPDDDYFEDSDQDDDDL
ncbi:MAG: hypothetical protein H5T86_02030 [Armatimonadetes bacterium]|nr:hypothetical protein [Armatimonadota bacterium]